MTAALMSAGVFVGEATPAQSCWYGTGIVFHNLPVNGTPFYLDVGNSAIWYLPTAWVLSIGQPSGQVLPSSLDCGYPPFTGCVITGTPIAFTRNGGYVLNLPAGSAGITVSIQAITLYPWCFLAGAPTTVTIL
ncbi:MAG: hypothetical protein KDC98_16500 [Planctomycetes bacterium]|nr:hypothetical protein [Planctomycetota bacterium]